jgi:CubicO group peptidase (beta-lactamase class C family)
VISVAHAQIAFGKFTLFTPGQFSEIAIPHFLFAGADRRIVPRGTRFYYASIGPNVLGVVLHYAVNRSASDYLHEKLWEPKGAEADARWLVDAEGFEYAASFFNATLRDDVRLYREPRQEQPAGMNRRASACLRGRYHSAYAALLVGAAPSITPICFSSVSISK